MKKLVYLFCAATISTFVACGGGQATEAQAGEEAQAEQATEAEANAAMEEMEAEPAAEPAVADSAATMETEGGEN